MTGAVPSATRRSLLKGGLALGAVAGLAPAAPTSERRRSPPRHRCRSRRRRRSTATSSTSTGPTTSTPSVLKGFQKEYGVKIIESNFDSMEGMYAKIHAGNQYDIVFPIAKWVVKMRREGKLRAIDHGQLSNADQVFYSGSYFNDPWYDAEVGGLGAVHRLQDRDRLAHRQGRRDDRQLARPVEPAGAPAASSPSTTRTRRWRWPRCSSATTSTPPRPSRARRDQEAADQPEEVPPRPTPPTTSTT